MKNLRIRQALISVSDKRGVVDFAKALAAMHVRILSTGGTAEMLAGHGIPVTQVGEVTGFPEMLDGRVKTLHPAVHGGILARRDRPEHLQAIAQAGIDPIDLVVVNLYPFAATIAKEDCSLAEAVENIDIGGPAMLRAAAKNYGGVGVVVDPADYALVLAEMAANDGALSENTRFTLAKKGFAHTASYDGAIANYLGGLDGANERNEFPERLHMDWVKLQDMRYGENPHQRAAFYRAPDPIEGSLAAYEQLQGKELSYNNIADADAAWECAKSLTSNGCVIVKHANPCGVALAPDARSAYERAFSTDPVSAFGGIVAFNCAVDAAAAEAMNKQFVEVLIAPAFDDEALKLLAGKSNLRVLRIPLARLLQGHDYKRVGGGLLVQTTDEAGLGLDAARVVSKRAPTAAESADLHFAWRVAAFVKSNAIVYCGGGMTLGIGAGQMSRVDSARIASIKAAGAGLSLQGSVAASDAFFPFRDGVEVLARAGATAVIQPGGSVRDDEVIAAADEFNMAMLFTGTRHFRH